MTGPVDPNQNPNRPATTGPIAIPSAKPPPPLPGSEGAIRIPVSPAGSQSPVTPAQPAPVPVSVSGEPGQTQTFELGKPQLRLPEIKLSAPVAPPKPPPLKAPPTRGSVWAVRVGLLGGVALALGLVYWAVFVRLLPVTTEHRDKALEMTRLGDELEQLRNRWTPAQIEEMKSRYTAARATLFDPAQEVTDWQTQLQDQARMQILESQFKVGDPQPVNSPMEGLTALTAEVSVQPTAVLGSTTSAYARLLKFTEMLSASPKRLDFVELSVTGDSNSVSHAQAVLQIYAGEKKL